MKSMKIPVVTIPTLITAEKHFPAKTPLRWHLVSKFVIKGCAVGGDSCLYAIHDYWWWFLQCCCSWIRWNSFPLQDSCSAAIHEQQHSIAPSNSWFKPLILVPPTQACCGKALLVRWVYKIDSSWNNSLTNNSLTTNNYIHYNFNAETDHRSPLYTR